MSSFKFSYRGIDYELSPRENASANSVRIRFHYNGVKSFVFVYLPFDTSSRSDLEFLYRKTIRCYNEIQENLACVRSARRFSNQIYSL